MIKPQKINLKKLVKLTASFQIKKKNKTMITLAMLPLRVEVEEDKVGVLVVPIFQTFLKIFSAILEVVEAQEEEEILVIKAPI